MSEPPSALLRVRTPEVVVACFSTLCTFDFEPSKLDGKVGGSVACCPTGSVLQVLVRGRRWWWWPDASCRALLPALANFLPLDVLPRPQPCCPPPPGESGEEEQRGGTGLNGGAAAPQVAPPPSAPTGAPPHPLAAHLSLLDRICPLSDRYTPTVTSSRLEETGTCLEQTPTD